MVPMVFANALAWECSAEVHVGYFNIGVLTVLGAAGTQRSRRSGDDRIGSPSSNNQHPVDMTSSHMSVPYMAFGLKVARRWAKQLRCIALSSS